MEWPTDASPFIARAPQSDTWTTASTETSGIRADLKKAALDKVLYNQREVLDRLLVPSAPGAVSNDAVIITRIVDALRTKCAANISKLRQIVAQAKAGGDKDTCEKDMYPHLNEIFLTIEASCASAGRERPYFRQLLLFSSRSLLADDPLVPGSFPTSPDFPIVEVPPPRSSGSVTDVYDVAARPPRWRQCPAFLEVKSSPADSPIPSRNSSVQDTLAQGADYARAILSSRPFQLHVYGVFVTGLSLCVGMFDRRGILLSPEFDMFSDSGIPDMVTIILRLTWDMSPVDLGHDPTVTLLPNHTYYDLEYPRFLVKMSLHPTAATWKTFGLPLWSSHSLFGRGTSVWRAVSGSGTVPQILKNAWRSASRRSEIEIYDKIKATLGDAVFKGIATAHAASGDVYYEPGQRVTVSHLRRGLSPLAFVDAVLYRIALNEFGKPIWRYRSPSQFIGAILSALAASEELSRHKILHRDISAGNVLIKVLPLYHSQFVMKMDEETGRQTMTLREWIEEAELDTNEGFLIDFEFASFAEPPTQVVSQPILVPGHASPEASSQGKHCQFQDVPIITPDKEPGDGITGTTVFMAAALLRAIRSDLKITRTFAHDAESFGYVILYSLYKHASEDPQGASASLLAEFKEFFSAKDVAGLLGNRGTLFSTGPERSMPHLLAYLEGDVALTMCAVMTFNFLQNMYPEVEVSTNPLVMRSAVFVRSLGAVPFDEMYPRWIEGLREAAREASGE
ncbi:hypothetical protein OH76DRAFT_1556421 [Lentinus brumalis]|uniref:Fungal-type protein kinase domain-containing protein n=1 Tax=Lentinus brumalis TaxID=2498619 RepID=A0A371DAH4_9APHY|nr:hypothetical protein OH76DRAFT_1556421 [Polyporus brumalis]